MPLPPKLRAKYLARFGDLISVGTKIVGQPHQRGANFYLGGGPVLDVEAAAFTSWQVSCLTLLDQVLPNNSPLRSQFAALQNSDKERVRAIHLQAVLQGVKDDFEAGMLDDLASQIEAEIAADYMGQAEMLLQEGQRGSYDRVPAAVLAGAVLEESLRKLCDKQTPPVPRSEASGRPIMLMGLVDALKKTGVFNELVAKQLRAWADIRNKAAHGECGAFTRADVELMVKAVNGFLAEHVR